jgi:cell wall assembly regulator SMI1
MLIFPRDEAAMQNSDELRKFAQNCTDLADTAHGEPNKKRFERMAEAWNDLAQSQAWLDGEKPAQERVQEKVQENVQKSAQESPVTSVVEP